MNFKYLLFLAVMTLGMTACGDDEEEQPPTVECETDGVTYTDDIAAILNTNCANSSCHNDTDLANGFSVDDYSAASSAALFDNFLASINQDSGFSPMPRGGSKLDQCDIDKISAWIAAGVPE